jgi:hypothetical protein
MVCVTELIKHMDKQTKAAHAGTKYAESYMWSHDSLTQMTNGVCRRWMRIKGVWRRWMKPELGLNDCVLFINKNRVTETTIRYKKRPVGDQPELMPHDSSLNYDINCALSLHVMMTNHLEDSDPRKMRKRTPAEIVKCKTKLCHPETGVVPKSAHIIQDVKKVPKYLVEIVRNGGLIVHGLVNRNGHRALGANRGRKYNGPHDDQSILTLDDMGMVPEVQEITKNFVKNMEEKYDCSHVEDSTD